MKLNDIVNKIENKINNVVRHSITNEPLINTKTKVSKKDLKVVVSYWVNGDDFNKVKNTKLYNEQSGKYCRVLELLEQMNLERVN